jgi:hypothetical protein
MASITKHRNDLIIQNLEDQISDQKVIGKRHELTVETNKAMVWGQKAEQSELQLQAAIENTRGESAKLEKATHDADRQEFLAGVAEQERGQASDKLKYSEFETAVQQRILVAQAQDLLVTAEQAEIEVEQRLETIQATYAQLPDLSVVPRLGGA